MTHDLKQWPEFFALTKSGQKPYEVRVNDRNFSVGDFLCLREFDKARNLYTNAEPITKRVVSILHGGRDDGEWPAIAKGWVVMGLEDVRQAEPALPLNHEG